MVSDQSTKCIRPLKSVTLDPVINLPGGRTALLQLKAVRSIRILRVKTRATVLYPVEVVQSYPTRDRISRIPIGESSNLQGNTQSQSQTFQIHRELHEFIALRNKVYSIVRGAHRSLHCEFCGKIVDFLVFGPNPDGLFLSILGKRASKLLLKFVTDILHLTVKSTLHPTQCNCAGLSLVPEAVHSFLFDPAPFPITNTPTNPHYN